MSKRAPASEFARADIEAINKDDMADAGGFVFDNSVPQGQRAARLLASMGNPYCFKVGNIGVKLEFSDDAPVLQAVFADFLLRNKSGL